MPKIHYEKIVFKKYRPSKIVVFYAEISKFYFKMFDSFIK